MRPIRLSGNAAPATRSATASGRGTSRARNSAAPSSTSDSGKSGPGPQRASHAATVCRSTAATDSSPVNP